MKLKKVINVAIIGCGKIAEKHAIILSSPKFKQFNLVAVCDNERKKSDKFGKKYKTVSFSNIDDLLNSVEVDLVVICTSSGHHYSNALTVSKYKKNIIIEKPISLNLRDAKKIIKIYKKNKNRLFVVMQNRFNPLMRLIKETINKKYLGRITNISIRVWWCRDQNYYNQASWRGTWELDGGIFMNQGIHHLDMMSWLLGPVKSLVAIIKRKLVDIETEDSGSAILEFKNGAIGTIEVSTALRPINLENSITVLGEYGNIKIGGLYMDNLESFKLRNNKAANSLLKKYKEDSKKNNHYLFYEDILKNLSRNKTDMKKTIDGSNAIQSLELVTGIYHSVLKKKRIYFPIKNYIKNSKLKLLLELKK